MAEKLAGVLALAIWLGYVGFLAVAIGEPALLIIAGATAVMAAVDVVQTAFQRREESIRRG